MTMHYRAPAWLALLAILAGCTGEGTRASGTGWVPGGEERLTFRGAAQAQRAVRFDDGSEIEEYGRAVGGGWQIEYLYLAADAPDHALAHSFDSARVPMLFHRLAGSAAALGEAGRIERSEGAISFRSIATNSTRCFAFAADWPGPTDQAFIGYACGTDRGAPVPTSIEGLLAGLKIQPVVRPDHLAALPVAPDARGFALGGDRPGRGLAGYPIDLGRLSLRADAELL